MTGPLVAAVTTALAGRTAVDDRDAGVEQLALGYAGLIDDAAGAARYTKALAAIRRACRAACDPDVDDAFDKVCDALSAHSVASDLGPKLLSALDALGLTAKARHAGGKEGSGAEPADPIDELRARRAQRATG